MISQKKHLVSIFALLVISLFSLEYTLLSTQAATLNVSTPQQLIDAINTANSNGEADIININANLTFTDIDNTFASTNNALPVITTDITINGNNFTIARDSGASDMRFFYIENSATLALNDVILENGRENLGGAIANLGQLTLTNTFLLINSSDSGGAIYNGGNLTIIGGESVSNSATQGGVIYNFGDVSISNSRLARNFATDGGVIYNALFNSTTVIEQSTLEANLADDRGGVIFNGSSSSVTTIINSLLSGNASNNMGGVIYNSIATVNLINTTISGNNSTNGGVLWRSNDNTTFYNIANSIIWGNGDDTITNGNTTQVTVQHTAIIDDTYAGGIGNITSGFNASDFFVDPIDPTTAPNSFGDYHLISSAPAIDAGNDALAVDSSGAPLTVDIDDDPRIQGSSVEMGSDEISPVILDLAVTKTVDNTFPNTGTNVIYTISVTNNNRFNDSTGVTINENLPLDNGDLTFVSANPSQGTFTPNNLGPSIWDVGTLLAARTATLTIEVTVNASSGSITNTASLARVDQTDNNASNDSDDATITIGQCIPYETAYSTIGAYTLTSNTQPELSEAIFCANVNATADTIILTGNVTTDTVDNFVLFETALPTITSDITIDGNGFTINRDTNSPNARFFLVDASGSLNLENITLQNGLIEGIPLAAPFGGAVANAGYLNINNSTLSGNAAVGGGAVYNVGTAVITQSILSENLGTDGGAIISSNTLTILDSSLTGNSARIGGAIYNTRFFGLGSPQVLTVINSILSGNSASDAGGAIYSRVNLANLINSTISGNFSGNGGSLALHPIDFAVYNIDNSIIWGNNDDTITNSNPTQVTVQYTAINDLTYASGTGNITSGFTVTDFFLNPIAPASAPSTAGDYSLIESAPAIDRAQDSLLDASITTDFDGDPRRVDDTNTINNPSILDMGAQEFQGTAYTVSITASEPTAVENPTDNGRFTVTLNRVAVDDVIVPYTVNGSANEGLDYVTLSGSVTIPSGETEADIIVDVIDDTLTENDETVILTLDTSPTLVVDINLTLEATVTISDDDLPNVVFVPNPVTISEPNATAPVEVRLGTDADADVTLNFVSQTPDVCIVSPTSLTVNDTTPQSITVTAVDDNIVNENNQRDCVIATILDSTATGYSGLTVIDLIVNVLDDDTTEGMIILTEEELLEQVSELPTTGETPWWRTPVQMLIVITISVVVGYLLLRVIGHKKSHFDAEETAK